MKNEKKTFILVEAVLAVLVILLTWSMLQEKNGKDLKKVAVVIQNSDDNQWAAFKYGLKMAVEDQGIEMSVVSVESALTVEEEKNILEREIDNGADAVIVQPVPGTDAERMLKKIQKKVPVILVEDTVSKGSEEVPLPAVIPDNYEMGATVAEELRRDYSNRLEGKTLGIFTGNRGTEAAASREQGFRDGIQGMGATVSWSVSDSFSHEASVLESQSKVDFVIALDDESLTMAGAYALANHLHGALIYGIGNSTEAVYYLDTGMVKCLVVPDEFNVGYRSLTAVVESMKHFPRNIQGQTVSYTVLRQDTLFLKENQEILFTMSQ